MKNMTIQGKIFRALFFIVLGISIGFFAGYKTFNRPQTVNEVNIKRIKGRENSSIDLGVNQEAATETLTRKEKRKQKRINKRNR